jgi:hypothetical protein
MCHIPGVYFISNLFNVIYFIKHMIYDLTVGIPNLFFRCPTYFKRRNILFFDTLL